MTTLALAGCGGSTAPNATATISTSTDAFGADATTFDATFTETSLTDAYLTDAYIGDAIDALSPDAPEGESGSDGATDGADAGDANDATVTLRPPPAALWQVHAGSPSAPIFAQALTVDSAGNVNVLGMLQAPVDFGTGSLPSGYPGFLASWDATGHIRWARALGMPVFSAHAIAHDGAGNIAFLLTVGRAGTSVDVGDGSRTAIDDYDGVLVVADSSGKTIRSTLLPMPSALAMKSDGSVLIYGQVTSRRSIGIVSVGPTTSGETWDYLLSMDAFGNAVRGFSAVTSALGAADEAFDFAGSVTAVEWNKSSLYARQLDFSSAVDLSATADEPLRVARTPSGDQWLYSGVPSTDPDAGSIPMYMSERLSHTAVGSGSWSITLPFSRMYAGVDSGFSLLVVDDAGKSILVRSPPNRAPSPNKAFFGYPELTGVDEAGVVRWQASYDDTTYLAALAFDPSGDIYVAGRFGETLDLGMGPMTHVSALDSGIDNSSDMFLARLRPVWK